MKNAEFIRLKKVSEMTSLSTSSLRKMIKKNELRAIKIGNNYYVTPENYNRFLTDIYAKGLGFEDPDLAIKLVMEIQKEEAQKKEKDLNNLMSTILNPDIKMEDKTKEVMKMFM